MGGTGLETGHRIPLRAQRRRWLAATCFIGTPKDNGLQEWLSRCHFGFGSDKYPDSRTQAAQYKLALAE